MNKQQLELKDIDGAEITDEEYGLLKQQLEKKLSKIKHNHDLSIISKISSYLNMDEFSNSQENLELYSALSGKTPTGNKLSVLEELELHELVSFSCSFLALFNLYPKLGNLYQQSVAKDLKEFAEKNQINIILANYNDGLKQGEFGRFSGAENFLVFDSCGNQTAEKVITSRLKERKLQERQEHIVILGRKLGKTMLNLEYFNSELEEFQREIVPIQDDFPYAEADHIDQTKAEFKKSPLERLNKKKAAKAAKVSPLLKGLMGKQ